MAATIRDFACERGITCLMHFTRMKNLDSILARGLVPRNSLLREGFDSFNDQLRLDGTDAVCLSIGFPNYKMFFGIKKDHADEKWAILLINPQALWDLDCAFCSGNAASNSVTEIPLSQRRTLAAFKSMYSDFPEKPRSELGIPDHYPTNPQAEVLALQGVPRTYITGVVTLNESDRTELLARYPDVQVFARAGFFRYRKDYEHWRA